MPQAVRKRARVKARESARPSSKAARREVKYAYSFAGGRAEGSSALRDLLGGKGCELAEMTNMGVPVHLYLVDQGRTEQESALDADAVGSDSADRNRGFVSAAGQANDGAPYQLDALAVALDNTQVNRNVVAHP